MDNMNGMEMMMKSFGIDPEKIKADFKTLFETTTEAVKLEVQELKATQARIEAKLDKVLEVRGQMDSMNVVESEEIPSLLTVASATQGAEETRGAYGGHDNGTGSGDGSGDGTGASNA
jgi:hypothetical protein